jgi:transcriptional regulator with XRE-family HTH domain
MADEVKRLIKAMKKKREVQGYSLRQLASAIGVSFSTLARIERGDGAPDNNSRIRILEWLGDDAKILGLSFENVALVHFRASKNIDSKTVHCLLQVADALKRRYGAKFVGGKSHARKHDSLLANSPPIVLSKPEMEAMAQAFRKDLGLNDHQPLDPLKIAIEDVKVLTICEIPDLDPTIRAHLEGLDKDGWSAMSVPVDEDNDRWVIVRNEQHPIVRQRISLLEEFWHILLGHKLTKIAKVAEAYGRTFAEHEEHDAFYLGAATLLPEVVIGNMVNEGKDITQVAQRYGTSPELVEYRIKRLGLWRQYRGKSVRLI